MIKINKKELCSGCTACKSICPKQCISMQCDEEGFLYPHVDEDKCINCNKCDAVCPVLNPRQMNENYTPNAYLVQSGKIRSLSNCTSGGVYTTVANYVINNNGIAFGAAFGNDFTIIHTGVCDANLLYKLSGSKYVQSDLTDTFSTIKNKLDSGKQVLFCGTPCQTEGLVNFLHNNYENLFLIDLVCHGVPSPFLWANYRNYVQNKYGKYAYINFRSKKFGYHVSVMEERFENGKTIYGSARTNYMLKCFFANIADRPICYSCPFKRLDRVSDMTLFDGWHADSLNSSVVDDDMGFTTVLIHTEKGKRMLDYLSPELRIFPVDTNEAIAKDGQMAIKSVPFPATRTVFYQYLSEFGLESTVRQLLPIKGSDYLIEHSKFLFSKLGILHIIKRVKDSR